MTLAVQSLVLVVLMVCGAVAAVPLLLARPGARLTPALRVAPSSPSIWLVESQSGQWFINGSEVARANLPRLLRRQDHGPLVRYLPSDALPLARVSTSLRWLRSLAPGAVVLELPPTGMAGRR
ncbi:MAG: hypothetical protein VKO44_04670 [Cyanobacteriota bacterium]|nr:hypothetical protein [Cyanobacteriota bacterium]